MTHPDILKMERDGFLGDEPVAVERCDVCGEDIYDGDDYYDIDGEIVCDEYECRSEYMQRFKVSAWR